MKVRWLAAALLATQAAEADAASRLTLGIDHTCRVTTDGTVSCWGTNEVGQLGRGSNDAVSITPGLVIDAASASALGDVTHLTSQLSATCALSGALVSCWGSNAEGLLGTENADPALTRAEIAADEAELGGAALDVSMGFEHTCAVVGDSGAVQCWGSNAFSQLANPAAGMSSVTPVPVETSSAVAFDGVRQIAAGAWHTCALTKEDTIACWGWNEGLQAGNSDPGTAVVEAPHVVGGPAGMLVDATAVASGGLHTCAVVGADAIAMCWGYNSTGQLGRPTMTGADAVAGNVLTSAAGAALAGVRSISAGYYHSCAVTSDGATWCWGANEFGQLGNGTTDPKADYPTRVVVDGAPLEDAVEVVARDHHTCALLEDDSVYCWGSNASGELGIAQGYGQSEPQAVVTTDDDVLQDVVELAAGADHTCARRIDGAVYCWGRGTRGQLGTGADKVTRRFATLVESGETFVGLAANGQHTCGVGLNANALSCWGWNASGQLGTGDTADRTVPALVMQTAATALVGVTDIGVGSNHTCAVKNPGSEVWCWGANDTSQIGALPSDPVATPGLVGFGYKSVTAGAGHTCGTLDDGTARCWGANADGQLGNGSNDDAWNGQLVVAPSGAGLLLNVAAIEAGVEHTCAQSAGVGFAQRISCWGRNDRGQLGVASAGATSTRPVVVANGQSLVLADVGANAACFRNTASGEVKCWGDNRYGELGTGRYGDETTPAASAFAMATQIAIGDHHTCGVMPDGTVQCAGRVADGQLGNGESSVVPYAVQSAIGSTSETIDALFKDSFEEIAPAP